LIDKDAYKNDYRELNLLPEVFKINDLAKFLTVSKTTIYNLIITKKLPHLKIDRTIIIFKQQFIDWYNKRNITPLPKVQIIKNLPPIIKIYELNQILNISKSKLYSLIDSNLISHSNIGTRIIIFKNDFLSWISKLSN
jgi:hypothetical protein